jgi:hypothetical protein
MALSTSLTTTTLRQPGRLKDIVENHLRKRLGDVRVRDFRTVHGQRLISQIPDVEHKSLMRIRAILSAVFTFALRTGVFDGQNPMHAVSVPGRLKKYKPPSYDLDESAKIARAVHHSDAAFVLSHLIVVEFFSTEVQEPSRTCIACILTGCDR